MNIPNILTTIRFFIVPFFGYFFYIEQYQTVIALFLLSGITDILDGYIARKYNLVTTFGKLADPVADKLMQITVLGLLTYKKIIPAVFIILIVAREIFMGLGSILLYKKSNYVVSASWYGKFATVLFYIAVTTTIIVTKSKILNSRLLSNIFIGIAVAAALFAFIMYSRSYRRIMMNRKIMMNRTDK